MKRILAIILTITLLAGYFPAASVHVHATEAEELPVVETTPEETTEPVTEATDPVEETTAPATEATEPVTEETEPVTEATEPVEEKIPAVSIAAADVSAASTTVSDTCGEGLTWTLDSAGKLTITGTGPMDDGGQGAADW